MGADADERRRAGKSALVEAFETFGSGALRDIWLFDQTGHEAMFVREDVESKIADLDVARFVDNERYGYVTRDTYGDLYYAEYEYTVRGFDGFEQFRTFLSDGDEKIGVFASFDRRDGGYDFGALYEELTAVVADYPTESFAPEWRSRFEARLSEPARDGRANAELTEELPTLLDVPVRLESGASSSKKRVAVSAPPERVLDALTAAIES